MVRATRRSEVAARVRYEDVAFDATPHPEPEVGRVDVGYEHATVEAMNAQKTLAATATFARFTGTVPIERQRKRRRSAGSVAGDGSSVPTEGFRAVCRIQSFAERLQITD